MELAQSGLDTPDTSLSVLAGVLQRMLSVLLCDRKCLVWRTVSPKGACYDEGPSKKKKSLRVTSCDNDVSAPLFMHFVLQTSRICY